jgi:hypothetical protein
MFPSLFKSTPHVSVFCATCYYEMWSKSEYETSRFCHNADENCALLGCNAVLHHRRTQFSSLNTASCKIKVFSGPTKNLKSLKYKTLLKSMNTIFIQIKSADATPLMCCFWNSFKNNSALTPNYSSTTFSRVNKANGIRISTNIQQILHVTT